MTATFTAVVADIARKLSAEQVAAWCAVLETVAGPLADVEAKLVERTSGVETSASARRLVEEWQRHAPRLPGAAVALALGAASAVRERADHGRARLVVSGPSTAAVPVRLTSSVVVGLVRAATRNLLVVSFAAYGVADVVRELASAAARGVCLDLVLETSTAMGGGLRGTGAAEAFAALRDAATFWHWPAAHRPAAASLHAKVVVADGEVALLGSANLTDRALSDNIEVGVLSHDRGFAGRLDRHFRALMRPEARCLSPLPTP